MHDEPESVKELIREGAYHYYDMCAYTQKDYITKAFIRANLDSDFDEFCQQPVVVDTIIEFAESEGIEEEAVHFAIEQRKAEFVQYLSNCIDEIARAANERDDD